ncbi:MAG: DHH family phosphoesterase [Candidatus Saccharibacteria bacterium]|nr:DHH family phosphoesterase [Candidatus Saccharibacteria bacterium]
MILSEKQCQLIDKAQKIIVCQAENPDGDSLGSALALEEIFSDMGKAVSLHCPVQVPTYLRYFSGWDRVTADFDNSADLAIIVDTSAATLMGKTTDSPIAMNFLSTHPVIVLDHHVGVEPDLPFKASYILSDTAVATGELIYNIAIENNWPISQLAATDLYSSIQSDSLGLTTSSTTAESFEACAGLVRHGAVPADIEEMRRELMKKSPRVLEYKGKLIERIEYYNDGRTAFIHIPFNEIHEYSNEYNPTMLVLDEMRLVTGVDVAIGVKTYPDGKLTGKVRTNIPVSNLIAKTFGGDGHPFAAGFRTYVDLSEFIPELVGELDKLYQEYDTENNQSKEEQAAADAIAKAEKNSAKGKHANLDGANLGGFKIKRKGEQ